jgi:hypothetical protein
MNEPYHPFGVDSLILSDMVLDIGVRRPNRCDHDRDALGSIGSLDTEPVKMPVSTMLTWVQLGVVEMHRTAIIPD